MLGVQHELAGGVIGLLFGVWLLSLHQPFFAVGCFLIAIWGATLPDMIDPPTSPFHRSIGHNFISFFIFLFGSLLFLALSLLYPGWLFIITAAFSFAVLSHLVLDMLTPMGLPLFVGKSLFGVIEIPLFFIPIINIIMLIITIILAVYSISILAKKVGYKIALMLLFIPVWGTLLLLGMALTTHGGPTLLGTFSVYVGYFSLSMFGVIVLVLLLVGHALDRRAAKKKVALSG